MLLLSRVFPAVLGTFWGGVLVAMLGGLYQSQRTTAVGALLIMVSIAVGFASAERFFSRSVAVVTVIWIVSLYPIVFNGDVGENIFEILFRNVLRTVLYLGVTTYAWSRGRMIRGPGLAQKGLAVYGYIEMLRSVLLLVLVIFAGPRIFSMTFIVLEDPFWYSIRTPEWKPAPHVMMHLVGRPCSIAATLFWYVVGTLAAVPIGIALARTGHQEAKACGVALLVLAAWVFSLPIFALAQILAR